MEENNVNNNVNPSEETGAQNEQDTQATPEVQEQPVQEQPVQEQPVQEPQPEPQPQVAPQPQPQQNGNQGAYNQPNQNVGQPPVNDGKATASLVCGIVSFFCGGFILGIIAVVLANMYFNETGDINNGKAKAGKICGIISIVLSVIVIIIYVAFFAAYGVRHQY